MNRKIYFANDDEESEYLAEINGLRPNVVVKIYNKYYRVYIYTIERLKISYETIIKQGCKSYPIMPGVIVINEATKKNIIDAILDLPLSYFENLKAKTIQDLNMILSDFREPFNKKFSEWVQVYPSKNK